MMARGVKVDKQRLLRTPEDLADRGRVEEVLVLN
jgi:hypothetical protein